MLSLQWQRKRVGGVHIKPPNRNMQRGMRTHTKPIAKKKGDSVLSMASWSILFLAHSVSLPSESESRSDSISWLSRTIDA